MRRHGHHRRFHGRHDECGCQAWGPRFHFRRRFSTREERMARLEEYLKELQAEAQAVQEHIAELKAAD